MAKKKSEVKIPQLPSWYGPIEKAIEAGDLEYLQNSKQRLLAKANQNADNQARYTEQELTLSTSVPLLSMKSMTDG